MYLHVGNQNSIREKDIIGIFDMDNATVSQITRKFLTEAQRKHLIIDASEEIPKSFILYRTADGYKIVFSQLSSSALTGRMK